MHFLYLCYVFSSFTIPDAFDDFFDSIIDEAITDMRAMMDRARENRRRQEVEPYDPGKADANEMIRWMKRAQPGARRIADARMGLEYAIHRIDELRGWDGPPGEGIPERFVRAVIEAAECDLFVPCCMGEDVRKFRTINGSCNDLDNPLEGAAFAAFRRVIPAFYEDGVGQPRGFDQTFRFFPAPEPFSPPSPSARFVSTSIIADRPITQSDATLMLMQWGQFIDHDYAYLIEASVLEPEEEECRGCDPFGECIPIPVLANDTTFGRGTLNNGDCLRFERGAAVCRPRIPGIFNPRDQLNQITHWLDGSMVYGSLDAEQPLLRAFRNGRLLEGNEVDGKGQPRRFMPRDPAPRMPCLPPSPCFRGGDLRANEQNALTAIHTYFVRFHNNLADQLLQLNPDWDDERTFQEARKIVIAIIQIITFDQYLPRMLGQQEFARLIGPYRGYDPRINGDMPNSFAGAAFRIGHSQVQPVLQRLRPDYTQKLTPLNLVDAFFNPAEFERSGPDPLILGLLNAVSLNLDSSVTSVLTNQLFERSNAIGADLAALNIARGRDHGLPSYGVYRRFCASQLGLQGSRIPDKDLENFERVYGNIDNADLWPAGIAEVPVTGGLLGTTFACIWSISFLGMREGDRFWYQRPGEFTPEQLRSLSELGTAKAALSRVICDAGDNIKTVPTDAFSAIDARVPCRSLPQLNLQLWQEKPPRMCWFKAQSVSEDNLDTVFRSIWKFDVSGFTWQKGEQVNSEPSTGKTRAACVTFACPTPELPVKVAIQAVSPSGLCISTKVIGQIPPNTSDRANQYKAIIPVRFGPQFGIYENLEECRKGGFSLTYREGETEPFNGIAVQFTF